MLRSALIIFLLAFSTLAAADGFKYSFISANYGTIDFDDPTFDEGDGLGVGASIAVSDHFHLVGSYTVADLDLGLDATSWGAGIGYNTSISAMVDFVAQLTYEYVEIELPLGLGDADDDGFGALAGLRIAPIELIEINAFVDYVDLSDSGDNTGFGANVLINLTSNVALGVGGSWDDDATSYSASARVYFGN